MKWLYLAVGLVGVLFIPKIAQDPGYHAFADSRMIWGVPNFWNVASNLPFLLVALYGLRALGSSTAFFDRWERDTYALLLFGTAAIAFGSAYYHWHPTDETLFWDRLPMAIVFMALVASTVSERVGKRLRAPLLVLGVASVLDWRWTGDLRLYVLVQFGAMAVVIFLAWRFPSRYNDWRGLVWLAVFYVLAKLLEAGDLLLGRVLATGGHPWKHVAAAIAMGCYVRAVERREPSGPASTLLNTAHQ